MSNATEADELKKFEAAVARVGSTKVVATIGQGAFSSFACAQDAKARGQHASLVAEFLSDAKERAQAFAASRSSADVYGVLAELS